MENAIAINELRDSLVEQLKRALHGNTEYTFEGDWIEVYLTHGERVYCYSVCSREDALVFNVSILNIQDIEVSYNDIMLESLEKILTAIKACEQWLTIWGVDKKGTPHKQLVLYEHAFTGLPESDDEAISYLNEVMAAGWEPALQSWSYIAILDSDNTGRYLLAKFE